jgi:hypothetical protein
MAAALATEGWVIYRNANVGDGAHWVWNPHIASRRVGGPPPLARRSAWGGRGMTIRSTPKRRRVEYLCGARTPARFRGFGRPRAADVGDPIPF